MRRLILVSFLTLLPGTLYAQSTVFVNGGANIATFALTSTIDVPYAESVNRLYVGGGMSGDFLGALGVEAGVAYSQRGTVATIQGEMVAANLMVQSDHAEAYLLARLRLGSASGPVQAYLLGGAAASTELSCDMAASSPSGSESAPCEQLEFAGGTDVGLTGGASVGIGITDRAGVFAGGLYTLGLKDLNTESTGTARHRVLTLRVGLSYSIGGNT